MWPWGHLAVGYLLYAAYWRLGRAKQPVGALALLVALGAQFPDLVDKPLAWELALIPNGRSLSHSLLTATVVLGALTVVAARYDRRDLAGAFALGYLSHLFADALYPLLRLDFAHVRFLAWPIAPPIEYEGSTSVVARLAAMEPTPTFLFEVSLLGLAFVAWYADGFPGLGTLRAWSGRLVSSVTGS